MLAFSCAPLAACSPAAPVSPSAGEPATTSAPSASAAGTTAAVETTGAATGAAAADAPRRLVLPDGVCRIATQNADGGGAVFRFAPGGAAFAKAGFHGGLLGLITRNDSGPPRTRTEVVLFDGQTTSAGLTFETRLVRVRGHVDMADARLHVAKAAVLGGFLVPLSVVPKRISAAGIEAAPVVPSFVGLKVELPPWHLACADLSITEEPPDPDAALPAPIGRQNEYMLLRKGAPALLSLTPGGAAVARLDPGEEGLVVHVLEKKGRAVRVVTRSMGITSVFGWVPGSSLEERKSTRSRGEEGQMLDHEPRAKPLDSRVCDKEVPLFAEVSGDRAEVGAILAGARIDVSERRGTFARVEPIAPPPSVFGGDLWPDVDRAKGASFWVQESALAECAPAPALAPSPPLPAAP